MAEEFYIPKLGQTVEEVTIVRWYVEDDDSVEMGQEILEVETDKAVFPVEANADGFIHLGPYKEGDVVPILEVVAIIGEPDDVFKVKRSEVKEKHIPERQPVASQEGSATSLPSVGADRDTGRMFTSPRARKLAHEKSVNLSHVLATGGCGLRVIEGDVIDYLNRLPKATPVARRMAAELGLDLSVITGAEEGGRITKADIERAYQQSPPEAADHLKEPSTLFEMEVTERVPLKGVRGIIAERMSSSAIATARVTLMMAVDATRFVEMRALLKTNVEEEWGFAPGYNDLLGMIVATALKAYPYMNAHLTSDAIEYLGRVNLGMAVDTDRGLIVPVIRDADQKSLRQFGIEFRELVDRAHNKRALPDDLTGGTFTITNLGMYDVDAFTPIINLPEAAILGFGRIAPRLILIDGELSNRQYCTLSLVFDHRVVDGGPAASFLQYIKDQMEAPFDDERFRF